MATRQPVWTLTAILDRAREVLREEGLASLVFRVLGELGYRRVILFAMNLEDSPRKTATAAVDVRFELAGPESVSTVCAISPVCDEDEVRSRIEAGQMCLLGYVGGAPAHISWLALPGQTVTIDFLGAQTAPGPGSAYSYELYVDPAFRGSGVAAAGTATRIRLLQERGIERMVSVVVPENRAGIGHTRAAGLRPIGRAYSLRLLGFRRCWIRSEVEPAPLRLLD